MAEYSVAGHEGMPTPQDGLIQDQVGRDVLQPGVLLPRTVLGLASPVTVEVLAYSSTVVGISPQTVIVILFIFTSNFFLFVIQF